MKKTWKKLLAFAMALAMTASCFNGFAAEVKAAETGKVEVVETAEGITIGNEYISREFSTADGKLSTVNITNKRTDGGDTVFTPGEGSEEFIIKLTKDAEASAPVSLPGLDRTGWVATADSYHNRTGASDGPAQNLLDGNNDSIWHSAYEASSATPNDQDYPHNVVINMGKEVTFKSFSYTPRQNGEATNGNILGYELWASDSAEELGFGEEGWTQVAKGEFEYNGVNPIYVNLAEECTATQVKFVATSSNNGQKFAGGAEFNLHADAAPVNANTRSFSASNLTLADVAYEATTATINSIAKTGQKITFTFAPFEFKGVTYSITENIVMYDGDHFMRKFMEIDVDDKTQAIDYIDLESFKVNSTDAQWTIPTDAGGVVAMDRFKANLGQPIYIQGMFFGCEFPQADTQIVDGTGYMRYYTGKTFERFEADNQLTTDGTYVTWQTVAGAARSTEQQVIQSDFFEYIYSIATPSEFRIQYNSWFDNMMNITDENILASFIEIDRELNKAETRPLDSYVVDDGWNNYHDTSVFDTNRSGTTLNTDGFWTFNSKFPEGLTPSSELVQKFGSNFGVWIGPRGGYNYQDRIANILVSSGKGSKAGGSIDVADREYVKNFTEMTCQWQDEYNVNYWKWDGFADGGQYNAFAAVDGVPGYANRHMTGGYQHMYHVTDLWEAWIDLMEAVRANAEKNNIPKLWISLTCYVTPSPWFLQWANSVWMQCVYDQKDASFGLTKLNKQLTYRDAMYYDFIVNHEFQFPLMNLYNHDPIYGKEGTGMNKNTATDDDFQNYLYSQSGRGTAFWELYFSDSIMTDGKYEVTGEFLAWAEENYHMLKNSKFIGGMPDNTLLSNGDSSAAAANAYGYSCFDGTDGLLYLRNSSASAAKTIEFTFDRTMGVAENAGTLKYHLEHAYLVPEGTATVGELTYGETYTVTLQPNESRILRVSKDGDTTAPEFVRAYSDGNKVVTVKFNEKVAGSEFTVSGAAVESVEAAADDVTFRITLTEALADNAVVEVAAVNVVDKAGNACTDTISFVHNKGNIVATGAATAENSLNSSYGFTVAATIETATAGVVVAQGDAYALAINEEGKATFTVNGATAVSDAAVADGDTIVGVKENNGILKLYVNATLAGSAYKEENRFYAVAPAAITVANATEVRVLDTAYGYDIVADVFTAAEVEESLQITEGISAVASGDCGEDASDVANIFDGDPTTYWNSNSVSSVAAGNPNVVVDLGEVYKINKVDYTPRYYEGPQNYWCCTGNIKKLVVEVSADGEEWTVVTPEGGLDISDKIVKVADPSYFPVSVEFEGTEARYVRISGTESYHWQAASANTSITIGDVAIFKVPAPKLGEYDSAILAKNAMANSEQWPAAWDNDGRAAWAFDDEGHWWHSRYQDWNQKFDHEIGSAAGDGKPSASNPIWIQTGFDKVFYVDHIVYTQRNNGYGSIKDYTVSVANLADPTATPTDADFKVVKTGTLTGESESTIQLDEVVAATHVRITVTSVVAGRCDGHVAAQNIKIVGYTEYEVDTEEPAPEPTPVDKSRLEALVSGAATDGSPYTADSWAAFEAALEAASVVLADEDATQEEVDAAYDALYAAELALTMKPVVNKAELEALIAEVSGKDAENYTEESWAVFAAALEEANAVAADEDATQEEVDAAVVELSAAEEALVIRPVTEKVTDVFTDVAEGKWYVDNIQYVYDNGLMSGNDGLFKPTDNVTRAQLVTTLYRLAGSPEVTDYKACDELIDVKAGKYYTDAVCWAYNEGITTGNGGKFDTNGNLTRQQMAAFFFRFAETMGFDTDARADFSGMLNADKVSPYAKISVEWAVGSGLITGSLTGYDANGAEIRDLNPQGATTRAQLAAILQRFCEANNL